MMYAVGSRRHGASKRSARSGEGRYRSITSLRQLRSPGGMGVTRLELHLIDHLRQFFIGSGPHKRDQVKQTEAGRYLRGGILATAKVIPDALHRNFSNGVG